MKQSVSTLPSHAPSPIKDYRNTSQNFTGMIYLVSKKLFALHTPCNNPIKFGSSAFRGCTAVRRSILKNTEGQCLKYSLLLAVLPRNKLDPKILSATHSSPLKNFSNSGSNPNVGNPPGTPMNGTMSKKISQSKARVHFREQ